MTLVNPLAAQSKDDALAGLRSPSIAAGQRARLSLADSLA